MNKSLLMELDQLLAEDVERSAQRESTEFDRLTGSSRDAFILFGAGNMGRTIARKLRTVGVQPIAFSDNNAALWGQQIEGIPVLSPSDAVARHGSSAVFLVSIWGVASHDRMTERILQLQQLGCTKVIPFTPLFWKYPELFLPYQMIDQPRKVLQQASKVRAAADLWSDEFSLREYVAQLKWRLRADFGAMSDPVPSSTYFPADLFTMTDREVFVDCGAFDGDTLRSFLAETDSKFSRILAFEPDPINYAKLRASVETLPAGVSRRIDTYPQASGSSNGPVSFSALGTDGSAVGQGDSKVDCVALDSVLGDVSPSHIKMDIEGAELDALEGARGVIARDRPILAICSYHLQSHMWQIPGLIHSICPDYNLFLRPHLRDGWDLVCYAVPPGRLRTPGV